MACADLGDVSGNQPGEAFPRHAVEIRAVAAIEGVDRWESVATVGSALPQQIPATSDLEEADCLPALW
jgi:hypothetical protein